ncbi:MAG TPA: MFS transporter [Acidimicrobiia bacterium]|jgi:MFS family permease
MRRVLLATAAATTACVFPPFLFGAMAVQVRGDLGFSEAGTGLGVAAFFATASIFSAASGRWAERLGGDRGLRLAALWSAAVQLAIAVLAAGLPILLVLLALAGTANALAQPAANLVISQALPLHRQGLGFAVKQSAIPASTMLAGLAVPAIALTAGWRWAFVGSALVSLASAAAVPAQVRWHSRPAAATFDGSGRAPMATMAVLSLGIALGAAAAGTLGAFLVSAGVEAGLAPGTAGLTLTLGSVVGIAVRLLAGLRADRRGGGHLRVVALMLALGSVAFALFATGRPGVIVAAVPLAFGAGWAWPGLFNLAVVLANPGSPAAATGITQTGTYLGAVAGPLGFGFLAEHVSFSVAWLVAAATAAGASVAIWAGRAMLRRTRQVAVEPLPPVPA